MRISQVKFSHDIRASQVGLVKNLPANAGDSRYVGLIPGSGRSPGVGNEKVFNFDEVQFICFLLLLFMLLMSYLRIHC